MLSSGDCAQGSAYLACLPTTLPFPQTLVISFYTGNNMLCCKLLLASAIKAASADENTWGIYSQDADALPLPSAVLLEWLHLFIAAVNAAPMDHPRHIPSPLVLTTVCLHAPLPSSDDEDFLLLLVCNYLILGSLTLLQICRIFLYSTPLNDLNQALFPTGSLI